MQGNALKSATQWKYRFQTQAQTQICARKGKGPSPGYITDVLSSYRWRHKQFFSSSYSAWCKPFDKIAA